MGTRLRDLVHAVRHPDLPVTGLAQVISKVTSEPKVKVWICWLWYLEGKEVAKVVNSKEQADEWISNPDQRFNVFSRTASEYEVE